MEIFDRTQWEQNPNGTLNPLGSLNRETNNRTQRRESNFPSVFLFFSSLLFFAIGCASLLPSERRAYPKNPITLPNGMDFDEWMESKKNQFPDRLRHYSPYPNSYKIMFYRKNYTNLGSYISCGAFIRLTSNRSFEIIEMVSNVNHADYSISQIPKGGELGPMNEKERAEVLLPCIEEFLTPPPTKE